MSASQNRSIAVLNLPKPVPALLKTSAAIVAALTGNTYFPTAGPLITALGNAQTALTTAETATKTRALGSVAVRNTARTALLTALHSAKALVQQAADADLTHAPAIIASAGMAVRKTPTASKPPFAAEQGPLSGTVKLAARAAADRASYEWQWSTDGGHTWTPLPPTLQAKTALAGVVPGTNGEFRFRAVTKAGASDWSQPAALIVK